MCSLTFCPCTGVQSSYLAAAGHALEDLRLVHRRDHLLLPVGARPVAASRLLDTTRRFRPGSKGYKGSMGVQGGLRGVTVVVLAAFGCVAAVR